MGSLVLELVGCWCTVYTEKWRTQGKLVHVVPGQKGRSHRPTVLILEDRLGRAVLVRGWDKIVPEA